MPRQIPLYGWASGYKSLRGLEQVVAELNRQIVQIQGRTLKGLIRAQIKIRRDMDLVPPKIPVDLGNLRSSYFCVASDGLVVTGASPVFVPHPKRPNLAQRLAAEHAAIVASKAAEAAIFGKERGPCITMGFTAYYGPFVHEMVGANFKRPGAGAKFFEAAIKSNSAYILRVIAEEARIR